MTDQDKSGRIDLVKEVEGMRENQTELVASYQKFIESYARFQDMQRQFEQQPDGKQRAVAAGARLLA